MRGRGGLTTLHFDTRGGRGLYIEVYIFILQNSLRIYVAS